MSINRNSQKKIIRQLLQAKKDIKDLENKINKKYEKKAKKDLEQIARLAIDEFYNSYSPLIYDRIGDLYNAFKVEVDENNWSIKLDSSFMNFNHHQDNEIVFNNTIIEGFHGGSMGEGVPENTPYWRTPHPFYTEWSRMAERSESPIEIIESEYNKYMNNISSVIQNDFDKRADIILDPVIKQIEYMFG